MVLRVKLISWSCYLSKEVFVGPGCVMQPFDQ